MNIIVFSQEHGRARQFDLRSPAVIGAAVAVVFLVAGMAFAAGSLVGARYAGPDGRLAVWSKDLAAQRAEIEDARRQLQTTVDALAMRVGQMNAHVIRLDALGKRITEMAKLDKGEFDFDSPAPVGGFEGVDAADASAQAATVPVLTDMLDQLSAQIDDRERQLGALENVILTRELRHEVYPQGRPVLAGFISSFFGHRVDPFTGRTAFHAGVDFAGPPGSQVMAVATGVVSYVGERMGYGNVVEVNHGNGYVTRYAHNQKNLVKVGDTVQKGDVLSLMGSTGRSTGPHVHFEVLRDGRQIDPMSFINRNASSPLTAARCAAPLGGRLEEGCRGAGAERNGPVRPRCLRRRAGPPPDPASRPGTPALRRGCHPVGEPHHSLVHYPAFWPAFRASPGPVSRPLEDRSPC